VKRLSKGTGVRSWKTELLRPDLDGGGCFFEPLKSIIIYKNDLQKQGARSQLKEIVRMRNGKLSAMVVGIALGFLLVSLAQAADFSAVVVTKSGGQQMQGKIYMKGNNIRREFSTPEGKSVSILRADKKVMWMLMPGQKMYMEMPFGKETLSKALNLPKDKATMNLLGTEKLNGYDTEKYEATVNTGAGTSKVIMWVAKKLGVPIKIESADKSFSQDYQDIKEGGVSDSLFEIPAGYHKMAMPAGMPRMR
jgi:outer membrane lipoprotein-sorting protein